MVGVPEGTEGKAGGTTINGHGICHLRRDMGGQVSVFN